MHGIKAYLSSVCVCVGLCGVSERARERERGGGGGQKGCKKLIS